MWQLSDGTIISSARDFVDGNGIKRDATILAKWKISELAKIGVKPFREVRYDSKHYISTGFTDAEVDGEIVRTHTTAPRYTVEELKEILIANVKEKANRLLAATDWYVVRASDPSDGTAVPQDVQDARAAIRSDADAEELAIDALTTYEDLVSYQNS